MGGRPPRQDHECFLDSHPTGSQLCRPSPPCTRAATTGSPLTKLTDAIHVRLALLPWLGLPGLTFVLGVVSALLFAPTVRARWFGGLLLLVYLGMSWASFVAQPGGLPETFPKIALVQTGWSQEEKWKHSNIVAAKLRLLALTDQARRRGAELVVWPETAWPENSLLLDPGDMTVISDLARRMGVKILASSLEKGPSGWSNSVSLVEPESGFVAQYRKRRLIPIQEYLPLPGLLDKMVRGHGLARSSCHYRAGEKAAIWEVGGSRYVLAICYESTVPWLVTSLKGDIDFVVIVTNGATLRSEFAKEAHFRSAILRAAQIRKPVLQASNDGVTGVIDGRGCVLRRLPPDFRGPDILMAQ